MELDAGYLFHDSHADIAHVYDLAELTPQCGRRADSLKLFLSLSYYGTEYFSQLVATAFERANDVLGLVKGAENLVSVTPERVPCLQMCFYYVKGGKLGEDEESNSRVTATIARRLITRGFMIDFAAGEKGKFSGLLLMGGR